MLRVAVGRDQLDRVDMPLIHPSETQIRPPDRTQHIEQRIGRPPRCHSFKSCQRSRLEQRMEPLGGKIFVRVLLVPRCREVADGFEDGPA